MITTELELMQASADAEQEAQELLEKFTVEWLGKRGAAEQKAKMMQAAQPPQQMQQPPMPPQPQGQQVMYG